MSNTTPLAATAATLDPADYLARRVDDQIDWYDRKSQSNQSWFKWLRAVEIVAAALIPFLTALPAAAPNAAPSAWDMKYFIGALGVIITVIAGILALYQFQERWRDYRATCESLRRERFLFLTRSDPYNVGDAFSMFVQKVETLLSKENTNWAQSLVRPERRSP
jgi:hypothetical protein